MNRVLIAGATGGVGSGIAQAFLQAGWHVVVPGRKPEKLEALRQSLSRISTGKLDTIEHPFDTEDDANLLKKKLSETYGNFDCVVASLGGWWQGQVIWEVNMATWNRILANNLTSHFLAIKAFVPLLNGGGIYAHINGFSAEQSYAKAGPVAMAAAAQRSLILTLSDELGELNKKVYELILGPINTEDRVRRGFSKPEWLTPTEVGTFIATDLWLKRPAETIQKLQDRNSPLGTISPK